MSHSDQVQALHRRYQESLFEKALELEQNWVSENSLSPQQLETLHAKLHQLAGSTGMYGYAEIAEQSRALMQDVDGAPVDQQRVQKELQRIIQSLKLAGKDEEQQ